MTKKGIYWTEEEDQVLREMIGNFSGVQIGKRLGRTTAQVNSRVGYLRGIDPDFPSVDETRSRRLENEKNIERFLSNNPNLTNKEVGELVGRSTTFIRNIRAGMGEDAERIRQNKLNLKRRKQRARASLIKEKKEANLAYKRAMEREKKADYGIFKDNFKVELGKTYRVVNPMTKIKQHQKHFTGKVIQETKDHFTLENKLIKESFLKVDFLINEYRLEEVK